MSQEPRKHFGEMLVTTGKEQCPVCGRPAIAVDFGASNGAHPLSKRDDQNGDVATEQLVCLKLITHRTH